MFRYLVMYGCLLLCYFQCSIILLVVLSAVVVIVLFSSKINFYFQTHRVSVKCLTQPQIFVSSTCL